MSAPIPPGCAERYRITGTLGAGGQGTVYRARQLALDREVALKVLSSQDPEFHARFLLEARIAARLDHINVVQVLDHDVESGRPWIAYEFVPGPSLRQRLADGPLPWREVATIGAGIARGLAAAHAIGAIHRDVKPENILLADSGPKVADFGLARYTGGPGLGTLPGMLLGTPTYMAPEVMRGVAATAALDLYAFGVMLFEMLAGRPPFESLAVPDLLRAHVFDQVPDLRASATAPPPRLRELIECCLSKEPSARPATAADIASTLEELIEEGGAGAAAKTRISNVPRPLTRQPAREACRDAAHPPGRHGARDAAREPARSRTKPRDPALVRAVKIASASGLVAGLAVAVALYQRRAHPPEPSAPATVRAVQASSQPLELPATLAALAPLEERLASIDARVLEATARARAWEVEVAAKIAGDQDARTISKELVELAHQRDALAALDRNLREVGDAFPESLAVEARRAQVAGIQFDVWFWTGWLKQYVLSGSARFAASEIPATPVAERATGGQLIFREFSLRVQKLAARVAARPSSFDARVADAFFQTMYAFRFVRTEGDGRFFSESNLPAVMKSWVKELSPLPAPMGAEVAEVLHLMSQTLVVSGDARKFRPKLEALIDKAIRSHPEAAGWTRLLELVRKA